MSNVTVAYQGWDAANVNWGELSWGNGLNLMPYATGQVGDVFIPTVVNGVSCTGYVGYVTVWGQVVTNQDPNWQNIAT